MNQITMPIDLLREHLQKSPGSQALLYGWDALTGGAWKKVNR